MSALTKPRRRDLLHADELHLLQVNRQPPQRNDLLSFNLKWYTRTGSPKYTAISYTWGDEQADREILIDNRAVDVSSNLWWCLFHISRDSSWEYVWIDALCIDQENYREKSGQVREMAATYRDAEVVMAWLGREYEDAATQGTMGSVHPVEEETDIARPWCWEHELEQLSARRYWSRRWIAQELFHARRIEVCCGTHRISWEEFRQLLDGYSNPRALQQNIVTICKLLGARERRFNVLEILVGLWDLSCKVEHDWIFALLSLLPVVYRKALRPDYSMDYSSIRERFVGLILLHEDPASLRHAVCSIGDPLSRGRLSSFMGFLPTGVCEWQDQLALTRMEEIFVKRDLMKGVEGSRLRAREDVLSTQDVEGCPGLVSDDSDDESVSDDSADELEIIKGRDISRLALGLDVEWNDVYEDLNERRYF